MDNLIGDDPLEVTTLNSAVRAAGDRVVGETILGHEGQHVADHQHAARSLGCFDHGNSVRRLQGDRLFAKDVLAGREGCNRGGGVQRGGQANVNHVELGFGQHYVEIGVLGHAGEIHQLARRTEITLDRPPVAPAAHGVQLADGLNTGTARDWVLRISDS